MKKKLIEWRKEKGLSREQLGNMIGMTGVTIWKWENENFDPKISQMTALRKALNLKKDDVIIVPDDSSLI